VVHVSVDGLRSDVLQNLGVSDPVKYPTFQRLISESAYTYNARSDFTDTETVPNHITMITGRPVHRPNGQPDTVQHGYDNNIPQPNDTIHAQGNPNVPYKASVFDVVHDNGLSTAMYASKSRLQIIERSYDAAHGAPDLIGADNGMDKRVCSNITEDWS
jgi:Type I phosphodiesterase / nucleotide pyrophosphatase